MAREQDHYTRRAKEKGYPARSVFKLEEIQKRYRPLKPGGKVLDIGASPGSWSMFAVEITGKKGAVVAVDLLPEKPGLPEERYTFIQGDAFSEKITERLTELGPYTTVISDAALSTTGNRTVDTARSFELVEKVLDLALLVLSQRGNLVAKVFQGGDEKELVLRMRQLFKDVHTFKPKASRKGSFETFLIGIYLQKPNGLSKLKK